MRALTGRCTALLAVLVLAMAGSPAANAEVDNDPTRTLTHESNATIAAHTHHSTPANGIEVVSKGETDGAAAAPTDTVVNDIGLLAWYCGYTCDNKDPHYYAVFDVDGGIYCADDAVSIDTKYHNGYMIQLRYSPFCRTAWIKTDIPVTSSNNWHADVISNWNGDCTNVRMRIYVSNGHGMRWSKMVNDANLTAIGHIWTGSSGKWTVCY